MIRSLNLFEDQELGDLEKMAVLEAKRKHGRKDYPVQSLFIASIAQIVLQLKTDAQFSRQLNMNSQLRRICDFEPHGVRRNNSTVKLFQPQQAIADLYQFLPDFGKYLALDGKIIETYASPYGRTKDQDKRTG